MDGKLGVAIVGCGLMGRRRTQALKVSPQTKLVAAVDADFKKAESFAREFRCEPSGNWRKTILRPDVNIVIVSTPNYLLSPITCAALKAGKHVLMEKPMGRSFKEAQIICRAAQNSRGKLKVGFNHRYLPAVQKAHELFTKGVIGKCINIRAEYGHGGRPGYEKEWRCDRKLSGGGELMDQGVHLVDLVHWFAGQPNRVASSLQTSYWKIAPCEDNATALFEYARGYSARLHASWTHWKNEFLFDIFGTDGFLSVNGLGGSYGKSSLTVGLRKNSGGAPALQKMSFAGWEESLRREWLDFVSGITLRRKYMGAAQEGLSAMRTLDALYRSDKLKSFVKLQGD